MKKKLVLAILTVSLFSIATGCGTGAKKQEKSDKSIPTTQTQAPAKEIAEDTISTSDDSYLSWLPAGATQMQSEIEPNEALKKAVIDYYEIPEESWGDTRYYYNYVDLDGDGTQEIFAVIIGMYTSGSGGDSALWCQEKDGGMEIRQAFTLIRTPILVTEKTKDLILERGGGGAPAEIVELTCKDGIYDNVSDAKAIANTDGIKGTAILCNDLAADMESGKYLTLAD